ncbi:uncharacterized protein [Rutidosis leptorrhynchoides]|uniref:uncharacterized protein n=1 Tax=Rutidosis leptorrhynchoides TaxID=125765 RepID=UPI003A9A3F6B
MVGKSGGQMIIWDTNCFVAEDVIKFDSVLGIRVRDPSERFNYEFIVCRARRFNKFIIECGLIDVPIRGRLFTRISDDGTKFSKLDRFLVFEKFHQFWGNLAAVTLDRTSSDHVPIVLKDERKDFGPKPFKVFDVWLDEDGVDQVIVDAWEKPTDSGIDKEIEILKDKSLKLELKAETVVLNEAELESWKESRSKWLENEKIKAKMLKQKAQLKWNIEGDENTSFFHSMIRNKYNRCNICGLNIKGIWCEEPRDIKAEVFNHFKKIFDEPNNMRPSLENLVYPSITNDEAHDLERAFSESKIHEAILDCGSSKAPGPDGFNLRFYKKFWELLKEELVDAINWFWCNEEISRGCNASFVTLVPKKSGPVCLNDYRPISLIESYYKIIAKLLSIRLRKVLPSLM